MVPRRPGLVLGMLSVAWLAGAVDLPARAAVPDSAGIEPPRRARPRAAAPT